MTIRRFMVRTGSGRSAPRGSLVLALAGTALLAAATIHSDRPSVRRIAQGEAAERQPTEHLTAVLNAVRGAHPLTCRLAVRALENRWGRASADLPGPETAGAANDEAFGWAVGGDVDPALIPALRTALADPDPCVRRTAAVLLGHARVAALGGELRTELAASMVGTRQAALLALGYAGKRADIEAASGALRDADPTVKLAAVWSLGRIGDPAAARPLLAVLDDADPVIRATAAVSLGQTESTDAIPALAELIGSDPDPRVRRAAAAALGQIDK